MHLWHRWKTVRKFSGMAAPFGLDELKQRAVFQLQSCSCGRERVVARTTEGVVFRGDPLLIKGLTDLKSEETH